MKEQQYAVRDIKPTKGVAMKKQKQDFVGDIPNQGKMTGIKQGHSTFMSKPLCPTRKVKGANC